MKIVFPEYNNPVIQAAIREFSEERLIAVPAADLGSACAMVAAGEANALIAGIDYTTREVVIACREGIGVEGETFSSCFVLKAGEHTAEYLPKTLILADAGVTKHPTLEQLRDIILQTYETARKVLDTEPRVAMLSFSTLGSARDASIEQARQAMLLAREVRSEMAIDGELQLDAAVSPEVAAKKAPGSKVAGRANVLIAPDLNAGNILYKALEQFGGYTAAGPILQGFKKPASDLSRGSTVEDVKLVIETLMKIAS